MMRFDAFGRGVAYWEFDSAGAAPPPPPPPTATKLFESFPVTGGTRAFGYDGFGGAVPGVEFSTDAVFYLPLRFVSGVYQTGVVSTSTRQTSWLPAPTTAFGYVNAQGQVIVYPVWRQFMEALSDRLGGAEGPRVPDVVTTVETTQAAAIQATAQVAAVAQQSQANAEALAATVEVARNNSLTGADQIPPVVLTNYEVQV